MKTLRNIISIPVAATLGIFAPGFWIKIQVFFLDLSLWIGQWLPGSINPIEGYIFFFIPADLFWIYLQSIFAGSIGGLITIFIALKIAFDKDRNLYISLFLTSLLINSISIYSHYSIQDKIFMFPNIISNLFSFFIAGGYPLICAIKNTKISIENL